MKCFDREWYAKIERLLKLKTMSEMNKNQLTAVKAAYSHIIFEFEARYVDFKNKDYQKYYIQYKKAEAMLKTKSDFGKVVVEILF